jgi:hypothetical protein
VHSPAPLGIAAALLVACGARTGEPTVPPFAGGDDASVVYDAGTPSADAPGENDDATGVCHGPDASVPYDGSLQVCVAARDLLLCGPDSGFPETCLSDDLQGCPDARTTGPCSDLCEATEYAVSCGDLLTPLPTMPPPPGCHTVPGIPDIFLVYCCPCGV